MNLKYSIIIFSFLLVSNLFSQENKIIYNKITDIKNDATYDLIKSELTKPSHKIFNNLLYCGPNLWNRYSKIKSISKIEKGNIEFEIPNENSIVKKTGKLIQKEKDFQIIWKQLIDDFAYTKIYIRKLTSQEIEYYWSIVFFDINEPIFIIENESYKIIVDFDENGNIIFIEEFI